jgi:hypothetical protein
MMDKHLSHFEIAGLWTETGTQTLEQYDEKINLISQAILDGDLKAEISIRNPKAIGGFEVIPYSPTKLSAARDGFLGHIFVQYFIYRNDFLAWLKNSGHWPLADGCKLAQWFEAEQQNQADANGHINWNDWLSRDYLSLDELLLLSLEENPNDKDLSLFGSIGLNDDETYNKRRSEAISWIKAGLLQGRRVNNAGSIEYEQINPVTFFTLAESNEWDLAQEIIDFLHERQNHEAETVEYGGTVSQVPPKVASVNDEETKARRRNSQIDFICAIAKNLDYPDLLNIPKGGKAAIKFECLKNTKLFTPDGFKRAWVEAGKRNLISMKDKKQYL